MSNKFHIGPNGPGPCNATKRACPIGGDHFDTEDEADAAYRKMHESDDVMVKKRSNSHRDDDGPVLESPDGSNEYWKHGKKHRANGPAVTRKAGTKEWWVNGKKNHEGAPIEYPDGNKEWWVNGTQTSPLSEKIVENSRNNNNSHGEETSQLTDTERRVIAKERVDKVIRAYTDYYTTTSVFIEHQALENMEIKESAEFTTTLIEAQDTNFSTVTTARMEALADKLSLRWARAWSLADRMGYDAMGADKKDVAMRAAKLARTMENESSAPAERDMARKNLIPLLELCGILFNRETMKPITPFAIVAVEA